MNFAAAIVFLALVGSVVAEISDAEIRANRIEKAKSFFDSGDFQTALAWIEPLDRQSTRRVIVVVGFVPTLVPTPFGDLLVDPLTSVALPLQTTTTGIAVTELTVPTAPPIAGIRVFGQALVQHADGMLALTGRTDDEWR